LRELENEKEKEAERENPFFILDKETERIVSGSDKQEIVAIPEKSIAIQSSWSFSVENSN
jgi:hypothetical protein